MPSPDPQHAPTHGFGVHDTPLPRYASAPPTQLGADWTVHSPNCWLQQAPTLVVHTVFGQVVPSP